MSLVSAAPLFTARNSRSGYEIEQSLRFNSADSTNLSRTPSSTGNRKTFTVSCWVKRAQIGATQMIWSAGPASGGNIYLYFTSTDELQLSVDTEASGIVKTTQKFRDPSAWYHIVCAVDTSQSTAANRVKFFINGTAVSSFASASYPSQNHDTHWNHTSAHRIGQRNDGTAFYINAYIAEFYNLDGTAVSDAEDFAEADDNGVWRPIAYTGSHGTNGFYLKFESSGIGTDSSGNGNNFTPSGFTTSGTGTDVLSDTPTTNWCTFNPTYASQNNAGNQFSEGNLKYVSADANWRTQVPTFGSISSGKWYWEWSVNTVNAYIGIIGEDVNTVTAGDTQLQSGTILYYSADGSKRIDNVASSYGSAYNNGGSVWSPTVGVALDKDNNTITFYRNGTTQGTINLSSSSVDLVNKPVRPAFLMYNGTSYGNFGQFAFQYTPPTGYKALSTDNLPAPTIKKGSSYFDTVTYSGATSGTAGAGTTQTVTGLGFSPDLVWIKNRSNANSHGLFDQVRGAVNALRSDLTNAEATTNSSGALSAFNSNGFTLANGSSGSDQAILTHQSGYTYVAWAWDANGSGSSNTAGSITSTVSANPSAGFSIATYTGAGSAGTVGHGLGVAPKFLIVKNRSSATAYNWYVWHTGLTSASYFLQLNTTNAQINSPDPFNATAPSSTVFSVGGENVVNTVNYVAYCFSEVEGYSKIGSYKGNGNADGPFIYTGFRPAWIMIKNKTLSGGNWRLIDTARETYNVGWMDLYANNATGETAHSAGTTNQIDVLSNGFKIRDSLNETNRSSDDLVFIAFAENPFGGSGISPATAH
jgi:hypothetical protein